MKTNPQTPFGRALRLLGLATLARLAETLAGRWVAYMILAGGGVLLWHRLTHQAGESWLTYGLWHLPWYVIDIWIARPKFWFSEPWDDEEPS